MVVRALGERLVHEEHFGIQQTDALESNSAVRSNALWWVQQAISVPIERWAPLMCRGSLRLLVRSRVPFSTPKKNRRKAKSSCRATILRNSR